MGTTVGAGAAVGVGAGVGVGRVGPVGLEASWHPARASPISVAIRGRFIKITWERRVDALSQGLQDLCRHPRPPSWPHVDPFSWCVGTTPVAFAGLSLSPAIEGRVPEA